MDDWSQRREDEKSLERAKSDGIEASGALMRRLAMGELEQELQGDEGSEDDSRDADESNSGTETSGSSAGQKRVARSAAQKSGRPVKATKLDKVSTLTDAIALAIGEMNQGNSEKYSYLSDRLQFEREEAERKRAHEIMMEERRLVAEKTREERQIAAEREREQFMLKLVKIAMSRGKENEP